MLLLFADIVAPHLADIFNYSVVSKTFLDDFKIGKVSPLFKNGEREDLNNYRPISVLPSIARVFEKIIYKQLLDFFNSNKLLSTKQWGFRNLHSTVLALLNSSNNWYINIDKGDTNGVIFLDIKKAFDTIDHRILLKKLSHYGVSEDSLLFIKSYLINRTQCCSVNGKLSSIRQISYGVPHGSILGPLLFIIFMNDLPNAVKSADICMYADDTSMSSTIKNTSDLETKIIPKFLNICNWLKSNKLTLNALKTEFMIMGSHQRVGTIGCARTIPAIVADGKVVKRVAHTKSLGIVVDEYFSLDKHIDYISKQLKRNIGVIKRVCSVIRKQSLVTCTEHLLSLISGTVIVFEDNVVRLISRNSRLYKIEQPELSQGNLKIIKCSAPQHWYDIKSMIIGFREMCKFMFLKYPGVSIQGNSINTDVVENMFSQVRARNG